MSMMMFMAWFEGMAANIEEAPSPKQWALIVAKIEELRRVQGTRGAVDFVPAAVEQQHGPQAPAPQMPAQSNVVPLPAAPIASPISLDGLDLSTDPNAAQKRWAQGQDANGLSPPTGAKTGIQPVRRTREPEVPTTPRRWKELMIEAAMDEGLDSVGAVEEWRDGFDTDPPIDMRECPHQFGRRIARKAMGNLSGKL